jgi:hypothetical protein
MVRSTTFITGFVSTGSKTWIKVLDNTDGSLATSDIPHPPPTIFLSYSRRDANLAGVLARKLQERGSKVFLDVDIPAGEDLRRWIEEAISKSNAMVVLAPGDETSLSHSFTGYEVGYATAAGIRVIVVTLADLPIDNPLASFQLIQVSPGNPEDTAPYIAKRIIESLGEEGTH